MNKTKTKPESKSNPPEKGPGIRMKSKKEPSWVLEASLIAISLGLTILLWKSQGFQLLVLFLFFLPVVLASFYLGRYRGGVLALFCVITAGIVISADFSHFWTNQAPVFVMGALTVWGATLGLTSIMIGSLRDDLRSKIMDSQEAHIGVIEVLSQYLQSANPNLQSRTKRVADLSERIARRLRLSESEVSNIRVAALLVDVENIEVTSRVIRKAMGEIGVGSEEQAQTFAGSDLVQSIGDVVTGIMPLLLEQDSGFIAEHDAADSLISAEVVRAARGFDNLMSSPWSEYADRPYDVLNEMQEDIEAHYHPAVLRALESTLLTEDSSIAELAMLEE